MLSTPDEQGLCAVYSCSYWTVCKKNSALCGCIYQCLLLKLKCDIGDIPCCAYFIFLFLVSTRFTRCETTVVELIDNSVSAVRQHIFFKNPVLVFKVLRLSLKPG